MTWREIKMAVWKHPRVASKCERAHCTTEACPPAVLTTAVPVTSLALMMGWVCRSELRAAALSPQRGNSHLAVVNTQSLCFWQRSWEGANHLESSIACDSSYFCLYCGYNNLRNSLATADGVLNQTDGRLLFLAAAPTSLQGADG